MGTGPSHSSSAECSALAEVDAPTGPTAGSSARRHPLRAEGGELPQRLGVVLLIGSGRWRSQPMSSDLGLAAFLGVGDELLRPRRHGGEERTSLLHWRKFVKGQVA